MVVTTYQVFRKYILFNFTKTIYVSRTALHVYKWVLWVNAHVHSLLQNIKKYRLYLLFKIVKESLQL